MNKKRLLKKGAGVISLFVLLVLICLIGHIVKDNFSKYFFSPLLGVIAIRVLIVMAVYYLLKYIIYLNIRLNKTTRRAKKETARRKCVQKENEELLHLIPNETLIQYLNRN